MNPLTLFTPRELKLMALAAFVFSGLLFANLVFSAWDNPPSSPPLDNVPAPINVGADTQVKAGNLVLDDKALIARNVNVLDGLVAVESVQPAVRYVDKSNPSRTWASFVNYTGGGFNEFVIRDMHDAQSEFLLNQDGRLNLLEGLVTNYEGTDGIAIGACPHGDCEDTGGNNRSYESVQLNPIQWLRVFFGNQLRMTLSPAGHMTVIDGANDSQVRADKFCDEDGSGCFEPSDVSGGGGMRTYEVVDAHAGYTWRPGFAGPWYPMTKTHQGCDAGDIIISTKGACHLDGAGSGSVAAARSARDGVDWGEIRVIQKDDDSPSGCAADVPCPNPTESAYCSFGGGATQNVETVQRVSGQIGGEDLVMTCWTQASNPGDPGSCTMAARVKCIDLPPYR